MEKNFYEQHRKKIWISVIIFSVAYLLIHYFIFDKDFHWQGLTNFIAEGKHHLIHIAPVIIIFFYFLIREALERKKIKKNSKAPDSSPRGDRGFPTP